MKRMMALMLTLGLLSQGLGADFKDPVRLKAGDELIRVDSPGYAYPCWHDFDGDGKKDLIVGQFAKGKMKFYKHQGDLKFAEGKYIQAEGKDAEVPGVW